MVTPTLQRGLLALALLSSLSLTACDSGEPDDDGAGEEEFITQVTVSLSPTTGGAAQTIQLTYDEAGVLTGTTPAQATLTPGATYTGSVEFRDTINGEDITEEIEEEDDEHRIAYALTPSSAGTVTVTDRDDNGFEVGLDFELAVASSASGTARMRATLYHFDDEPKSSSTATSDEIDIEFEVPLVIAGAALTSR